VEKARNVLSVKKMSTYRDSERASDVFARAMRVNWSDRLRRGNVVTLPKKGDVFVTGDLHGNWNNFARVREIADVEGHPRRHLVFQEVLHGGMLTEKGACLSFQVLEEVAQLVCTFPGRVHMVVANHDLAEITDHSISKSGKQLNTSLFEGLQYAYGSHAAEVRGYLREFLLSVPLAVRTKTGIFICHSLPDREGLQYFDPTIFKRRLTEEDMETFGSAFDLVWGRELTEEIAEVLARVVGAELFVVGHTPLESGFRIANSRTIIVDTKDENARYLEIPLDKKLDLKGLRNCVRRVYADPGYL